MLEFTRKKQLWKRTIKEEERWETTLPAEFKFKKKSMNTPVVHKPTGSLKKLVQPFGQL